MTDEPIEIQHREQAEARAEPLASGWSYRPRMDVIEDADEFTILADLPGAGADDIRIDCERGVLAIRGTVPPRQPAGVEFLTQEYGVGDFDRELILSDAIEVERIRAAFVHGVLTIHLPKSEASKPRRIPVRAA